jgi:hypothetical protein
MLLSDPLPSQKEISPLDRAVNHEDRRVILAIDHLKICIIGLPLSLLAIGNKLSKRKGTL